MAFSASADLLVASARINACLHRFPGAGSTFIPKGLYRFRSHEEANEHRLECLARGMAWLAGKRR